MERSRPPVRLVCAICSAPVDPQCDILTFPIPDSLNREAEGLCAPCCAWAVDHLYRQTPAENALDMLTARMTREDLIDLAYLLEARYLREQQA